MGGGLSRHELAAAVSEAGGLGTIAVDGAAAIGRELAAARTLTGRPIAVNLLLPFARRDWFAAAAEADVVVTFWGKPRRRIPGVWMHQCGSVAEAALGPRGGRRRRDRPRRRGGRSRARSDAGAGAVDAGRRGRYRPATRCCSPGASPSESDVRSGARGRSERRGGGHPFSALGGEPCTPRIQAATARGRGNDPHRAVRRRLAGAAPGRRQRGDGALAGSDPRGPLLNRLLNRLLGAGRALHAIGPPGSNDPSPAPGQPGADAGATRPMTAPRLARSRGALRGGSGGADDRGQAGGTSSPGAGAISGSRSEIGVGEVGQQLGISRAQLVDEELTVAGTQVDYRLAVARSTWSARSHRGPPSGAG